MTLNRSPRRFPHLAVEHLEDRSVPSTFTVKTTADSGDHSLRWAIEQANTTSGADTIRFNIPGDGVHSIALLSALPAFTEQVTIAGQTQPGYTGVPLIELNGTGAGIGANGLVVNATASGTTIRGLIINQFKFDGIHIEADNCNVRGCYIGTDSEGSAAKGNNTGVILRDGASGNTIGGTDPAFRNIISGNTGYGVDILGAGTDGNVVQGNFIGTNKDGTVDVGNANSGILIELGASNNLIGGTIPGSRNVISGNDADGVDLSGDGSSGNRIQGNRIGTDKTGTIDLGNVTFGVNITGASDNRIGGTAAGAGNVISGNDASGVRMTAFSGSSAVNNTVRGNFIGTKKGGAEALGNSGSGVLLGAGASGNRIGGSAAGAGNVISGNTGVGVSISGADANDNRVQGNRIGVQATSTAALGNSAFGVFITDQAAGNRIGGTVAGSGNIIAHNSDDGVLIGSAPNSFPTLAGSGNSVLGNRIFANGGQGIDLGANDGVTGNNSDSGTLGPANPLNFPELSTAKLSAAGLTITGSMTTEIGKTIRIEFFATPSTDADPSGHGEGKRFLGFIDVTMNKATKNFSTTLAATGLTTNFVITATATDADGNTSEFSLNQAVTTG